MGNLLKVEGKVGRCPTHGVCEECANRGRRSEFATLERSFGRSLLFLKDQIKDLKASDRDLSCDDLQAFLTVDTSRNCSKVNLSRLRRRQNDGVAQVGARIWLVTFTRYDLGYFDDETCRLKAIDNPFTPEGLPMCSE